MDLGSQECCMLAMLGLKLLLRWLVASVVATPLNRVLTVMCYLDLNIFKGCKD